MTYVYSDSVARVLASRNQRSASGEHFAAPSQLLRQQFTVANETPRLQAPAWSDYVSRLLEIRIPRRHQTYGFRGELDTYQMPQLIYLDSRTDAVTQARTAARISGDNMRDYCFHVAVEGIIETVTGGSAPRKSEQFTPGILALDMNQSMHMVRPTYARVLAFFLPRSVVESCLPEPESLHGRVVTYSTPLTRMLLAHLRKLCRDLPHLPDHLNESSRRDCAQLILSAFGKQQQLEQTARTAARQVLLYQLRQHIEERLRDPNLAPEQIWQDFKLSRPTLYRMFEADGGLATYIRNCRLRAAAADLIAMPHQSVTVIAGDLGFTSASDFTRAFRRAYGMTPQDFRALGMARTW